MKRLLPLLALALPLLLSAGCASTKSTPDQAMLTLKITTSLDGGSAETMAAEVTNPLEHALHALPSMHRMRSTSSPGLSVLWVQTKALTSQDALSQVQQRVTQTAPRLPKGVNGPVVAEAGDWNWPDPR